MWLKIIAISAYGVSSIDCSNKYRGRFFLSSLFLSFSFSKLRRISQYIISITYLCLRAYGSTLLLQILNQSIQEKNFEIIYVIFLSLDSSQTFFNSFRMVTSKLDNALDVAFICSNHFILLVTIHPPGSPPSCAANRFAALIPSQSIAVVSEFTLESGIILKNVPVAFRTWGKLNER